jgi:SAM-dependent methyltransferase
MGAAATRWAEMVSARHREGGIPGGPGRMAQNLREAGRRDMTQTPAFQAVLAACGPERTVVDIGAGTGRYTLPLARAGCRVWAVEPSEQMRVYLEEDRGALPAEAAARIRVVTGNWPEAEAEVPPVEVALASLVIHFYPDAVGFLEGMGRAATRRCVLAIRAGQMEPLAARLWPLFHPDRPAPAQPVLRDLLAVMEEAGLRADVETHAPARPYGRYRSREEARSRLAAMLRLDSDADLARLDTELRGLLVADGDGWRGGDPVEEALVSWTPGH